MDRDNGVASSDVARVDSFANHLLPSDLATDGSTSDGLASDDLATELERHFGYRHFLPGQREVISHLLAGRSAAAFFPTGGGKSLCYQLPALMLPGVTLVVSPLIALMKDQLDALHRRGIRSARLDSTLAPHETREVLDDLRQGRLKLLYVAPERFRNERFRSAIQEVTVSLLAVDEAHCISAWGHHFRPDYLRIAQFAKVCGAERRLGLTATATPEVLHDICDLLDVSPDCIVRTGFYRPNLTLWAYPCPSADRMERLIRALRERPRGPTIVYVTLRATAEKVARELQQQGFPAEAYHAGLSDQIRASVQDQFMQSQEGLVVGTIAFGMGIDKPNIRYVYHYNIPKSLEHYAQEIGRSGRDGLPSLCEALVCLDDLRILQGFIYGDTPASEAVTEFLEYLFGSGENVDVAVEELMTSFDIKQIVVETLLTYLELDGYLESQMSYFASYKFQTNVSPTHMLAQLKGECRTLLGQLLGQARFGTNWFTLDAVAAARRLKVERQRIANAMEYLSEQGWIRLQLAGPRYCYTIRRLPSSVAVLADQLNARLLMREQADLLRLTQVVNLLCGERCRVAGLNAHFGEPLADACGHCDFCLPPSEPMVAARQLCLPPVPMVRESLWREALAVRAQHYPTLGPPRAFARWVCGIPSPKTQHERLQQHRLFGALQHVPFAQILDRATQER